MTSEAKDGVGGIASGDEGVAESKAEHTPGCLDFRPTGMLSRGGEGFNVRFVARVYPHGPGPDGTLDAEDEANGRRLAACWNACLDIPTDALEGGIVRELLAELIAAHDALDAICMAGHMHLVAAAMPEGHGMDSIRAAVFTAKGAPR